MTYQVRALLSPTETHVCSVHGTEAEAWKSLIDIETFGDDIGWDVEELIIVSVAPSGAETVL